MQRSFFRFVSVLLCAITVSTCANTTQGQRNVAGGAVAGAAVGALVGGATGGTKGALIGAAAGGVAGAAAGWALTQYQAQQTRSAAEEAKAVGYKREQGTVVKLRKANVTPHSAAPGKPLTLEMEYALLSPEDQVTVEEDWAISKDGQVLTSTQPRSEKRQPGGWTTKASINLPTEATAGTYQVKNRVRAGAIRDERETSFTVATATSGPSTGEKKSAGSQMSSSQTQADATIMQMQGRLKELGYDPGAIDGRPGQKTKTALQAFQRDYSLPVTGTLDAQTKKALGLPE